MQFSLEAEYTFLLTIKQISGISSCRGQNQQKAHDLFPPRPARRPFFRGRPLLSRRRK